MRTISHITLVFLFVCTITAHAVQYEIIELGTLGGSTSEAFGINDNGQVVGRAAAASGFSHAFVWDGTMTDLSPELTGINEACAYAINNNGTIAGWLNGPTKVWYNDGTSTLPNVYTGYPKFGINNNDIIVGTGFFGEMMENGYAWSSTGGVQMLATEQDYSFLFDINNNNQAVGRIKFPGTLSNQGVIWNVGGTKQYLNYPGSNWTVAQAINDNGQVVGDSMDCGGFLWQNGTYTPIGINPYDINNSGQVVGLWGADAYLWDSVNGAQKLIDLLVSNPGWTVVGTGDYHGYDSHGFGLAINNNGQIAGVGIYNGQERAFLMTPIPEPGTFLMLACGCLLLKRRRD